MNKQTLLKLLLEDDNHSTNDEDSFLEIGEKYIFRTVTMIYTGKIKAIRGNEILLTEAAWIAETKRWYDSLKDCEFNEVEPYPKNVIIYKTAFLDVTKLDHLPKEQK